MIRKILAFTLMIVIIASCKKDETTDYSATDKKIIEDYLTAHNLTAQSTASGLYYIIQKPGGSNHPNINSKVAIHYTGYLIDGTVFDNTYSYGEPLVKALTIFIKGWQEGVQLIGVTGKIKLLIPSALAYGTSGQGTIPANAVLVFDIELVDFY